MFEKTSEKITNAIAQNGTIKAEDKELYKYGIEQGMMILLNLCTTLIIGAVFKMVWQSILFTAAYIPIRSYAGGYHSKTPQRCYIFSILMIIAVLWGMKYFNNTYFICIALLVFASIIILLLSPVEDKNKPLDKLEKHVYKKRTLIILGIEILIILLFLVIDILSISFCMVIALFSLSIMLVLGRIKLALSNNTIN